MSNFISDRIKNKLLQAKARSFNLICHSERSPDKSGRMRDPHICGRFFGRFAPSE